jgi:hypothetical protein
MHYISISIYIHRVNLATDGSRAYIGEAPSDAHYVNPEMHHLEAVVVKQQCNMAESPTSTFRHTTGDIQSVFV